MTTDDLITALQSISETIVEDMKTTDLEYLISALESALKIARDEHNQR